MKELNNILVVSSIDPELPAGILVKDFIAAFQKQGIETDYLSLKKIKDNISTWPGHLFFKYRKKIASYPIYTQHAGYGFFYLLDLFPPVSFRRIIHSLDKSYDLLFVLYWHEMISPLTIYRLYKKYNCQVHLFCVDFAPITGGCHMIGDCLNFVKECRNCPAFPSNCYRDIPHLNILLRGKWYKKMKPFVYGNSYMHSVFQKSALFPDIKYVKSSVIVNTDVFYPKNISELRKKYNIPKNKKNLLFFGCQQLTEKRKGISYLIESLNLLYHYLSDEERRSIMLLIAGNNKVNISNMFPFDVRVFGFVSSDVLSDIFSLSTLFLNPSISDAGPMMVNQALCCGTPVISFKTGVSLDLIMNHSTGYCAQFKNSEDFANGIRKYLFLSDSEMAFARAECRRIGVDYSSYKTITSKVINTYYSV